MTHSCRAMLCESPHDYQADHSMECGCVNCHENHDWREWSIYPECERCEADMMIWLSENTTYFELQRHYGRAA
jgi:hypothetical protein